MILYQVKYPDIDWNAYFGGSNEYHVRSARLFTTRAKAEEFVAQPLVTHMKSWNEDVVTKKAGEGLITEICAD